MLSETGLRLFEVHLEVTDAENRHWSPIGRWLRVGVNEELGFSVIDLGTVVGTEFAPPGGVASVWWGDRAGGFSPAQIRPRAGSVIEPGSRPSACQRPRGGWFVAPHQGGRGAPNIRGIFSS